MSSSQRANTHHGIGSARVVDEK